MLYLQKSKKTGKKCIKTVTKNLTTRYVCPTSSKYAAASVGNLPVRPEQVEKLEAQGKINVSPAKRLRGINPSIHTKIAEEETSSTPNPSIHTEEVEEETSSEPNPSIYTQGLGKSLVSVSEPLQKSYVVPQSVRSAAKRGLELRAKQSKSQKAGLDSKQAKSAGIHSGVAGARALASGRVSEDKIRRMVRFFSRHAKNISLDAGKSPIEDKGYVAGLLWGGTAGRSWANKMANKIDREKEVKKGLVSVSGDLQKAMGRAVSGPSPAQQRAIRARAEAARKTYATSPKVRRAMATATSGTKLEGFFSRATKSGPKAGSAIGKIFSFLFDDAVDLPVYGEIDSAGNFKQMQDPRTKPKAAISAAPSVAKERAARKKFASQIESVEKRLEQGKKAKKKDPFAKLSGTDAGKFLDFAAPFLIPVPGAGTMKVVGNTVRSGGRALKFATANAADKFVKKATAFQKTVGPVKSRFIEAVKKDLLSKPGKMRGGNVRFYLETKAKTSSGAKLSPIEQLRSRLDAKTKASSGPKLYLKTETKRIDPKKAKGKKPSSSGKTPLLDLDDLPAPKKSKIRKWVDKNKGDKRFQIDLPPTKTPSGKKVKFLYVPKGLFGGDDFDLPDAPDAPADERKPVKFGPPKKKGPAPYKFPKGKGGTGKAPKKSKKPFGGALFEEEEFEGVKLKKPKLVKPKSGKKGSKPKSSSVYLKAKKPKLVKPKTVKPKDVEDVYRKVRKKDTLGAVVAETRKSLSYVKPYVRMVKNDKMSLKDALNSVPWFMQKTLLQELKNAGGSK